MSARRGADRDKKLIFRGWKVYSPKVCAKRGVNRLKDLIIHKLWVWHLICPFVCFDNFCSDDFWFLRILCGALDVAARNWTRDLKIEILPFTNELSKLDQCTRFALISILGVLVKPAIFHLQDLNSRICSKHINAYLNRKQMKLSRRNRMGETLFSKNSVKILPNMFFCEKRLSEPGAE